MKYLRKTSILLIALLFSANIKVLAYCNTTEMRKNNLNEELNKNGIYKYSFKKNYQELKNIKNIILTKYKDNIEWLEIENVGTRCILKLEERIKSEENNTNELRNIVALKDAVILDVKASNGIIVKRTGSTVKKGDIIISGNIYLNENIKNIDHYFCNQFQE